MFCNQTFVALPLFVDLLASRPVHVSAHTIDDSDTQKHVWTLDSSPQTSILTWVSIFTSFENFYFSTVFCCLIHACTVSGHAYTDRYPSAAVLALMALRWHTSGKRLLTIATLILVAVPFTTIFSSFLRFWTGTCLIFKNLFCMSIIINICRKYAQTAAFLSYYLKKNTLGILLLRFAGPPVQHTLKIIITRTNRVCLHFRKFP